MKSAIRLFAVAVAAFMLCVAVPRSPITRAQDTDVTAAGEDLAPRLVISEYRLRGPGNTLNLLAESDEFVEIYNSSDFSHRVFADDGSTGYALVASDGLIRFIIPNGTAIPARGHFLGVNTAGYSIGAYPAGNGTTATGDASYTLDIADFSGLALFKTSNPANFTLATRLDAVGYNISPALYREGAGFTPLQDATGINEGNGNYQYIFYRDQRGGYPRDNNNTTADFIGVETFGYATSAGRRLGAPGPENLSSPIQRNVPNVSPSDDFNDNSTDASKWYVPTGASGVGVVEQNMRLEITPPATTTGYDGYFAFTNFDLSNARATVQVVQSTPAIYGIETSYQLGDASGNYFLFDVGGGGFLLESRTNGVISRTTITYDPAQHVYWRFRHDPQNDLILYETSPDNVNWVTQRKEARPFDIRQLQTKLFAGKYTATTPTSTAIFDNLVITSNNQNSGIVISAIDPAQALNAPPNQVSSAAAFTYTDPTSGISTSFPGGSISFRRTVTNNTGRDVTRLRFRIVDISTLPAPVGQADLRAITSNNVSVKRTDGTIVTARGTLLEQPPMYRTGGGFNHSLSVTLSQPLANGASIGVQFLTGVRSAGASRISVNAEALP